MNDNGMKTRQRPFTMPFKLWNTNYQWLIKCNTTLLIPFVNYIDNCTQIRPYWNWLKVR